MKKVQIADLPDNASAYQLDDGRHYRIHLRLTTPRDQLATADYVEVETNGYEIDKSGAFMVDDNQEPIMLPKQTARIPLANFRAGADSLKAGWVQQAIPEDEAAAAEAVKDARKLKNMPKTAELGDKVLVDDKLYAWSEGLYEQVRRQRLADVPPMSGEAPLDDAAVQDMLP